MIRSSPSCLPLTVPSDIQTHWWVSVAHLVHQTVMTILYLIEIPPCLQPWGLTSAFNLHTLQGQSNQIHLQHQVRDLQVLCFKAKKNSIKMGKDCSRPRVVLSDPGLRQVEDGLGRCGAQESTHSSSTHSVFFLGASQGKWLQCPLKPWTKHVLHGPV